MRWIENRREHIERVPRTKIPYPFNIKLVHLTASFIYSMWKLQWDVKKIYITFVTLTALALFCLAFNINYRCLSSRVLCWFARRKYSIKANVSHLRDEFRCIVTCSCVHFIVIMSIRITSFVLCVRIGIVLNCLKYENRTHRPENRAVA